MTKKATHAGSDNEQQVQTYFAPAERKSSKELDCDVKLVTVNPLICGLMTIASGLFAVLNEQRQVLAVNDAFIKLLGIEDISQVLGLRHGECIECIHACEMPGGCGTSQYCSTCGAVVATMAALETGRPQERTCAFTVEKDHQQVDLYFSVRSCPLVIEGERFILFFMQDISVQQYRSCLDRTFFHDINNILCALVGKSEFLSLQVKPVEEKKVQELQRIVLRITQEINIHNALQQSLDASYRPLYSEISANSLLKEVECIFADHSLTAERTLTVKYVPNDVFFITDFHLASRIIINMVTNALEATSLGGNVILLLETNQNSVTFRVWNQGVIPEDVSRRIFQRNFSTKGTIGRGLGTYSMKLFGEKVLGGTVGFESSQQSGTVFYFTLRIS